MRIHTGSFRASTWISSFAIMQSRRCRSAFLASYRFYRFEREHWPGFGILPKLAYCESSRLGEHDARMPDPIRTPHENTSELSAELRKSLNPSRHHGPAWGEIGGIGGGEICGFGC